MEARRTLKFGKIEMALSFLRISLVYVLLNVVETRVLILTLTVVYWEQF